VSCAGPDFWGLVNPEWYVCTKGKRQSPINIDPQKLLFDANLRALRIDKHRVWRLQPLIYVDPQFAFVAMNALTSLSETNLLVKHANCVAIIVIIECSAWAWVET